MAGKSLNELHLSDAPIHHAARPADDRDADYIQFAEEIEQLLEQDRVQFAADTLEGIRDSVLKRRSVSDSQRRAVKNIEASLHSVPSYRRSRRYEGWGR